MSRNSFYLNLAVGGFVILVLGLVGMFLFLYGDWSDRGTDRYSLYARFRSTSNLRSGSAVRLSGRPVGTVNGLYTSGSATDGRYHVAVLSVRDRPEYRDAIRSDSTVRIVAAGVLGDEYIEIGFGTDDGFPLEDGAFVWGEEPANIGMILTDLGETVENAAEVTRILREGLTGEEGPLGSLMTDLRRATENIVNISESLDRLMGTDPGSSITVQEVLLDLKRTTANAMLVTEELKGILVGEEGSDSPDLRAILLDLQRTSANTAEVTEDLASMFGGGEGKPPVDLHQMLLDAERSAENLKQITMEIKGMLAGIKRLYPGNWFR